MPRLVRARELEDGSGQRLLDLNGGLMIGHAESEGMRNVLAPAEEFDLPHRVLDESAMAREYPQHRMRAREKAAPHAS